VRFLASDPSIPESPEPASQNWIAMNDGRYKNCNPTVLFQVIPSGQQVALLVRIPVIRGGRAKGCFRSRRFSIRSSYP